MPRQKKDGLNYFSFDVDFFHADKRIVKLHKRFGNDGIVFYIYLLTEIYRNGYYARWNEDLIDDAIDLNLTEGLIEQMMIFFKGRGLIVEVEPDGTGVDKEESNRTDPVITSPGIQRRYQAAVKSLKRDIYVDSKIWLLGEEETESFIKFAENEDKSRKNEDKSRKNEDKSRKNYLKEKKRNEMKIKQRVCVRRIEDFISAYPKDCNRYLTETAYIDLLLTGKITEDELVSCAGNYAETCRILETPERYIKKAESFLKDMEFEKYLPGKYMKPTQEKPKNSFNNFNQREYDFDELERQLVNTGGS